MEALEGKRSRWLQPCLQQSPGLQQPNEAGEIFLLPSPLQTSQHSIALLTCLPLPPPLPKPALGQPLSICRAAPPAPRLLFGQSRPFLHHWAASCTGFFSSSLLQPCRASPFPHPPSACWTQRELQNEDLGGTSTWLPFNSPRNLNCL